MHVVAAILGIVLVAYGVIAWASSMEEHWRETHRETVVETLNSEGIAWLAGN